MILPSMILLSSLCTFSCLFAAIPGLSVQSSKFKVRSSRFGFKVPPRPLLRVHGLFFLCALCLPSLNAAADSTVAAHPPSKTSQVVIVHDPRAVDAFRAQPEIVQAMVNCGITNLTGTATVRD